MPTSPSPVHGPSLHRGFILGIGSNIAPEDNAARMLDHLSGWFGRTLVSRCYYTAPVDIATAHRFVNACVYVRSDLSRVHCKEVCVGIETVLGRDRLHPLCKTRDRPADIDIIAEVTEGGCGADLLRTAVDSYLSQPMAEIVAMIDPTVAMPDPQGDVCRLLLGGAVLGEAPAAIDRDDGACLVGVVEDGRHRAHDRLGAAFPA